MNALQLYYVVLFLVIVYLFFGVIIPLVRRITTDKVEAITKELEGLAIRATRKAKT